MLLSWRHFHNRYEVSDSDYLARVAIFYLLRRMKTKKIAVYNHGNKLACLGFWHLCFADQDTWVQGSEYQIAGFVWDKDKKDWVERSFKARLITAIPDTWANFAQKNWLLHCDILKVGEEAIATYQKAWGNALKPHTRLVALRFERVG